MRKTKRFMAILLMVVVVLGGCGNSGVSQEEYDQVLKSNASLKEENENLEEEIESLRKEKGKTDEEYAAYKEEMKEYENLKEEEAEARKIEAERIIEEQRKEAEQKEAEELAKKEKEEKLGYETGITYNQLARTPEDYKGKKVKFSGKVIQILEEYGMVNMRLAVDSDYDKIILCEYRSNIVDSRILEDDIVTIYGVSKGLYTYKSTIGVSITVPLATIDKIDEGNNNEESTVASKIENLVYEDSNVKIYYNGITGKEDDYTINLTIENLSNKTLQISDKDTSINGYMADPSFVVTVAPGKKAKDGMRMYYSRAENFPMNEIENIETRFHISNEDNWKDNYDTENVIVLNEE